MHSPDSEVLHWPGQEPSQPLQNLRCEVLGGVQGTDRSSLKDSSALLFPIWPALRNCLHTHRKTPVVWIQLNKMPQLQGPVRSCVIFSAALSSLSTPEIASVILQLASPSGRDRSGCSPIHSVPFCCSKGDKELEQMGFIQHLSSAQEEYYKWNKGARGEGASVSDLNTSGHIWAAVLQKRGWASSF